MIGKRKVQPDVIDLSNESLARVLESLEYRKAVRYDMAFESCPIKQLKNKSLLLFLILNHPNTRLTLNGYSYKFGSTIERSNPDKIKPDKKSKWQILKEELR